MRSLCLLLLLVGPWCKAQNLVPNGSFEDHTLCPDWMGQIDRAIGWQAEGYTPDYMNACDGSDTMSVPLNIYGSQLAADGVAYAGIVSYSSTIPNAREYIGVPLTQPLVPGVPVYLSFKVALAVAGVAGYQMQWTTNNSGMRFSWGPDPYQLGDELPNSSIIHNTNVLTDTSAWQTVSGLYVPDSAYGYVLLGNFYDDALTTIEVIDPSGQYTYAYVYFDQVCVSYNPTECEMAAGIPNRTSSTITVFPNPFSTDLYVELPPSTGPVGRLWIEDLAGRCYYSSAVRPTPSVIHLEQLELPAGVFLLHYETDAMRITPTMVVHVPN